jgi:hypothetical protein
MATGSDVLHLEGIHSGEHGWRNIPPIIRTAIAALSDAHHSLSQSTQSLAGLMSRKANQSDFSEALSTCATQAQLQHLIETVHREVLPKFDSPCAAHSATNASLSALSARISQMETVISAQDRQIQALTREVRREPSELGRTIVSHAFPFPTMLYDPPQLADKASTADLSLYARKAAVDDGLRRVSKVAATQVRPASYDVIGL